MSHTFCNCYLLLLINSGNHPIQTHALMLHKCLKISSVPLTPQLHLVDGHLSVEDEKVLSHSSVHYL